MNTVLNKIESNITSLSPAEQQVAKYILDHPNLIQNLTIQEISKNANVSQATVFRFSKKIGFNSFKTFQLTLVKELSNTDTNSNINDIYLINKKDSPYQLFQKVTLSNELALKSLKQTLNKKDFEKAVEKLYHSTKIAFFGVGGSSPVAIDAGNKFAKIGYSTSMNSDFHTMMSVITNYSPTDIVILFSISGQTKDVLDLTNYAKKINVPTIAVTSFSQSPLYKLADIKLCFPNVEGDERIGTTTSRMMQLNIIDALYLSVFHRTDSAIIENYQRGRRETLKYRR